MYASARNLSLKTGPRTTNRTEMRSMVALKRWMVEAISRLG